MDQSQHGHLRTAESAHYMMRHVEALRLRDVEVAMILGIESGYFGSPILARPMSGWQFNRLVALAELASLIHALIGRDGSAWLRLPNPALAGRIPVALLTGRPDALPGIRHLLREEMGG